MEWPSEPPLNDHTMYTNDLDRCWVGGAKSEGGMSWEVRCNNAPVDRLGAGLCAAHLEELRG